MQPRPSPDPSGATPALGWQQNCALRALREAVILHISGPRHPRPRSPLSGAHTQWAVTEPPLHPSRRVSQATLPAALTGWFGAGAPIGLAERPQQRKGRQRTAASRRPVVPHLPPPRQRLARR